MVLPGDGEVDVAPMAGCSGRFVCRSPVGDQSELSIGRGAGSSFWVAALAVDVCAVGEVLMIVVVWTPGSDCCGICFRRPVLFPLPVSTERLARLNGKAGRWWFVRRGWP
ncbi:hypothetical protein RHMOL_Rhmol01G0130800 [Rhododendron molle]|uniref:Uncharacterized protein n=1 Tax=Rhododendron molle TaxID=49168 RepID=A0ACC0Q2C6_RHOML|nr:hypothetical protein RHMOL_Rhmol01G0130800 [Rhododendron molle]